MWTGGGLASLPRRLGPHRPSRASRCRGRRAGWGNRLLAVTAVLLARRSSRMPAPACCATAPASATPPAALARAGLAGRAPPAGVPPAGARGPAIDGLDHDVEAARKEGLARVAVHERDVCRVGPLGPTGASKSMSPATWQQAAGGDGRRNCTVSPARPSSAKTASASPVATSTVGGSPSGRWTVPRAWAPPSAATWSCKRAWPVPSAAGRSRSKPNLYVWVNVRPWARAMPGRASSAPATRASVARRERTAGEGRT